MKRLGRRVLDALTVLCLLVFVGVVVLAIRTYRVGDVVYFRSPTRFFDLKSTRAGIWVGSWQRRFHDPPHLHTGEWATFSDAGNTQFKVTALTHRTHRQCLGVHFFARDPRLPSYWTVIVPFWLAASVSCLLPLRAIAVWWRRHRRGRPQAGACRRCRYDLTGNLSGVCPECGSAIAKGDT